MKKIRSETDDWLRPEYERVDFGELLRGKYAITQLEFAELVGLMIACIGEDNNIQFEHHSPGNLARKQGDWTYEIDNANQVTLRHWLKERASVADEVSNPPCVVTEAEREELQKLLRHHVLTFKAKLLID